MSRAELVKLIASYFTVEGGTPPFPDVPGGHWAAEVVSFAAEEAGCRAIRTAPSGPTRR